MKKDSKSIMSSAKDIQIIKLKKIKANLPFDKKLEIFRSKMLMLKVDWRDGFCSLIVDRENNLSQSIKQIKKLDLYKELHINFKGEISNDAGGLIREWFTVIFKEIQKSELSKEMTLFIINILNNLELFEKADTSEFTYKISKDVKNKASNFELFNFIGKIIGKALLDNITINTCFNKIIYKMILEEEIKLSDLVFIDKPVRIKRKL